MALYIGLMSGTSLDGVDGVLARFPDDPSRHEIDVLAHALLLYRHLFELFELDLHIEVARVAHDRTVLHALEVLAANDRDVAGQRDEEVADLCGFHAGHDAIAVHDRFQRLDRIDFDDDHVGTHAARAHGDTAATPAVTGDDDDRAAQ